MSDVNQKKQSNHAIGAKTTSLACLKTTQLYFYVNCVIKFCYFNGRTKPLYALKITDIFL